MIRWLRGQLRQREHDAPWWLVALAWVALDILTHAALD